MRSCPVRLGRGPSDRASFGSTSMSCTRIEDFPANTLDRRSTGFLSDARPLHGRLAEQTQITAGHAFQRCDPIFRFRQVNFERAVAGVPKPGAAFISQVE